MVVFVFDRKRTPGGLLIPRRCADIVRLCRQTGLARIPFRFGQPDRQTKTYSGGNYYENEKVFASVLTAVLSLTVLSGCGGDHSAGSADGAVSGEGSYKIGIS